MSTRQHLSRRTTQIEDLYLEIARGAIDDVTSENKFGRALQLDADTLTDVWDRANSTDAQYTWTAPTRARIHALVSDNAADAGPSGVGARTIQILGLVDWDSKEVSEIKILNGTTPVNTTNSYVIIHRVKVLTWGASGPNVGKITVTAAEDSTVTAQIAAGVGQTLMAVYGIPSTQLGLMPQLYVGLGVVAGASARIDPYLAVNTNPRNELTGFVTKHVSPSLSTAHPKDTQEFKPPKRIFGPAIVKIQVVGTVAAMAVSAGFDLILIDN